MKIIGLIPARYASQRFPGKPLTLIDGKPMVQWVYEQALQCTDLVALAVATDDERIAHAVQHFGGRAIMTSSKHLSGTDRCAEAAAFFPEADAIINIQGDEPRIDPKQISDVAMMLKAGVQIATLARKEVDAQIFLNPNNVKVVCNHKGEAMYFSRSGIPFQFNAHFLHHVGIYGFKIEVLKHITQLPTSSLEAQERLEQLRWLEHGYRIQVGLTTAQNIAIDTEADLKKL